METGTDAAVAFLQRLYPEGLWVLTSIQPDRKGIETRSFTGGQVEEARVWIGKWNGKRNIYFSVNQPKELLNKKAEKADIARAYYLHVDIDPRAGEDLAEEQERIRTLVGDWQHAELPAPHMAIWSGGGAQLFYRLEKHVEIGGDPEAAEDFERYNKALELALGGDHCFNCDRIMRLPGTLNIPDAKKLKKGRVPVEAEVLFFREGTIRLDDIKPAPKVQQPDATWGGATPKVSISGNVQRISDINTLDQWQVPDAVKVIIVQGKVPDREDMTERQRHFSDSEWVFYAVCALLRHEVPDEAIFSLITDPAFGISGHVLRQKNVERYAVRQIERAREEVEEPMLRLLNERYAVIKNLGGKCVVVEEVYDPIAERSRLTKMSFPNFQNGWMNKLVEAGKKQDGAPLFKPAGKWWLEHPVRREYDHLIFSPGKEIPGCYNLWQGFAFEQRPGDWSLFREHIRENICAGREEHFAYLMGWMARGVQAPDRPGYAAVVLRGKQGTGKSFFVKHFGALFGRHFLQVADAKHLVGSFNAHLRDCVVLFGDEAFYAGDSKHEGVLKTLVTEDVLHYEAKGVDSEQGRNFVHLLMASNDAWVVPAGLDDRRFFVLDVSDARREDQAYFKAIAEQLRAGGYEAMLHDLMEHDVSTFNVRAVPKSAALREQQQYSMQPWEEAFIDCLRFAQSPDDELWTREVGADYISAPGLISMLPLGLRNNGKSLSTKVGMFLAKQAALGKDGKPVKAYRKENWNDPVTGEPHSAQRIMYKMRPRRELCDTENGWGSYVEFDSPDNDWGQGPATAEPSAKGSADVSDGANEEIPF